MIAMSEMTDPTGKDERAPPAGALFTNSDFHGAVSRRSLCSCLHFARNCVVYPMPSLPRFFFIGQICALAVFSLSLDGCSSGATVLVPVMGGREKVRVEFTSHGPAHASADGFEVTQAGFVPNPAPKPPDFSFTVSVKGVPPPRRIVIEDITEETAVLFFKDENPTVKDGMWHGLIAGIDAHDPRTEWLYRLNNDLRIYRFTITTADGHTLVLDQPSNYPTFLKMAIRTSFGEKL
jgi:hypothetical protein